MSIWPLLQPVPLYEVYTKAEEQFKQWWYLSRCLVISVTIYGDFCHDLWWFLSRSLVISVTISGDLNQLYFVHLKLSPLAGYNTENGIWCAMFTVISICAFQPETLQGVSTVIHYTGHREKKNTQYCHVFAPKAVQIPSNLPVLQIEPRTPVICHL